MNNKFPWYVPHDNKFTIRCSTKMQRMKNALGFLALTAIGCAFMWTFVDHLAK